jgi:Fic family protein
MYQPKYSINDNIVMSLIEFELSKKTIEEVDYDSVTKKNMITKGKAINLFHLSHMIGVELTIKDAEKAVEGKKIITNDARGNVLNNFRSVMEFIRSTVTESYVDLDINVMLHINKIILTGWKEVWESKVRTDAEQIDTTLDTWTGLINKDLNMAQRDDMVTDLIGWYKNSLNRIHPLIRVGVFIYEMIRIAPIACCNELTIIAMSDFLFQKNGYLENAFLTIFREFDLHNEENIGVWEKVKLDGDITPWLERFILNLARGTTEEKTRILSDNQMLQTSVKQPFLDLNRRQLKILRYLQTIPTVKREDYVQMMDVSTMTAFRDMRDLVKKKIIKIEGRGRGTKYILMSKYT